MLLSEANDGANALRARDAVHVTFHTQLLDELLLLADGTRHGGGKRVAAVGKEVISPAENNYK